MKSVVVIGFFLSICAFGSAEPGPRKLLFFDLWKLDAWNNLELRQGEPEWVRECEYLDPVIPGERMYFPSVWKDEESGKFRMVYSIKWSPFTIMAAESGDGVSWEPLEIDDSAVTQSDRLASHHLLTIEGGSGSGVYHDPKETDGYSFRIFGRLDGEAVYERALEDPDHQWHEIAKAEGKKRYMGEGITVVSKDGIRWEVKTGGHWDWLTDDWFPEPPVFAFWDEKRELHVMTARPGWGDRRQIVRESPDLKEWGEPKLQFQPDPLDSAAPLAFYGLPVTSVGNGAGFAGLLWTFRNSNSERLGSFNQFFGPMDAQLVYSYDGERFFRGMRTPFLKRNPIPEPGCVQIRPSTILNVGEEFFLYSQANRGAHGREKSEQRLNPGQAHATLMLHRLREDGWMYLASLGDWATFQTKPFVLRQGAMAMNARAQYGAIRFQLTDVKSKPIEGFTFEDCDDIRGDNGVSLPLTWQGQSPEALVGKPLRLEVEFRQANVFAVEMDHHFLDAQDLWLLEDGKPIPAKRFDF